MQINFQVTNLDHCSWGAISQSCYQVGMDMLHQTLGAPERLLLGKAFQLKFEPESETKEAFFRDNSLPLGQGGWPALPGKVLDTVPASKVLNDGLNSCLGPLHPGVLPNGRIAQHALPV